MGAGRAGGEGGGTRGTCTRRRRATVSSGSSSAGAGAAAAAEAVVGAVAGARAATCCPPWTDAAAPAPTAVAEGCVPAQPDRRTLHPCGFADSAVTSVNMLSGSQGVLSGCQVSTSCVILTILHRSRQHVWDLALSQSVTWQHNAYRFHPHRQQLPTGFSPYTAVCYR